MKELIEALQIFLKYKNLDRPTYCEGEVFYVVDIPIDLISKEDICRLHELSFQWSIENNAWHSSRFGSV